MADGAQAQGIGEMVDPEGIVRGSLLKFVFFESRVSQLKASPRNYGLLAELNTRPRTTYLAAVRNYNPEIRRG